MLNRRPVSAPTALRGALALGFALTWLPACDDDGSDDADVQEQIDQGERAGGEFADRITAELGGASVDVQIRTAAAIGAALDEAEIAHAEMALDRSDNAQVRDFAQMIVDQHTAHRQDAAARLDDRGLTARDSSISDDLVAEADEGADALDAASDQSFDLVFMDMQVRMHAQGKVIADRCSDVITDPAVSEFWDDTEDLIERHLDEAVDVAEDLRGS